MTDEQWQAHSDQLERQINGATRKAKAAASLHARLGFLKEAIDLRQKLKEHRLNRYSLVDNAPTVASFVL